MKPITLLGHSCTGHGAWPPRANSEGDDYLIVNGKPVHCVGHAYPSHCDPDSNCHSGKLAGGSALMTVNGNAVGRIGDPVSCGGNAAEGDGYWILD